jgi:hypothetical protein
MNKPTQNAASMARSMDLIKTIPVQVRRLSEDRHFFLKSRRFGKISTGI